MYGIVCQKEMSREREEGVLVMGVDIRLAVGFERVAGGLGRPGAERPASDGAHTDADAGTGDRDPASHLTAADCGAGVHGYAYGYCHFPA